MTRKRRALAGLDEEIRDHIERETQENIERGVAPEEARRQAMLKFGNVALAVEDTHGVWVPRRLAELRQDVRYALRTFRRNPGFAIGVVLTLALGIGATTAIFSLVDAVLLRRLPVEAPAQLVEVSRTDGGALSYPMYEAIRGRNDVFRGVLLTSSGRLTAALYVDNANVGDVQVSPASGDYFSVLGISPVLGRVLTEDDLAASNATVISHGLWQRAFAGDPGVLGRTVRIGRRTYTVVGVAPAEFTGVLTGQRIDMWVPITWFEERSLRSNVTMMFRVMARRKVGISDDQVRAHLTLIGHQLSSEWGFEQPLQMEVTDASGGLTMVRRQFARPLWTVMTVVALLLLITTVNVANLLLARASARQREIATRLSLGASRGRLIRQLLTESLVLGGVGGAVGLLLAPLAAPALLRFLSSATGSLELSLDLDRRLLAFTVAISLAVVALFGLAPAVAATRLDLAAMYKGSPRGHGGVRRPHPGKLLVVAQVAISCVLLAGAILFARSLRTITQLDAGFSRDNVLLLSVSVGPGKTRTDVQRVRIYERALERLARVPAVRSVALSSERLFGGNTWTEAVIAPGFIPQPGQDREAVLLVVSPGFFETFGTAILHGRAFEPRDDDHAARVAIVNDATARYYFGRTDAVGQTFTLGDGGASPIRVIGVVQDAKYRSLKEPAPRIIYLPALQVPGPLAEAYLAIRTVGDAEKMADLLWKEAQREVAELRWHGVSTQARLVEGTIAQDRMLAQLSGAIGLTAMLLVGLGLYGLTAYEVSRRTSEIGVRLALGAERADVVRLIVGRSLLLVIVGVLLGLGGATALGRLVESLLFSTRGSDLVTLLLTAAMLFTVGTAAAYWAARRAARLNPLVTLRTE